MFPFILLAFYKKLHTIPANIKAKGVVSMLFFQVIAFMIIVLVGYLFRTSHFNRKTARQIEIALGVMPLGLMVVYQISMVKEGYAISFDLPLHLCGIMSLLGSLALLFRWKKVLRFLAAPVFCGPFLSLLFPYAPRGVELTREVYFFSYHTLLILLSLYVIWVTAEKLTKYDYLNSLVFVLAVGMASIWYNKLTGGNYVFTVEPIVKTELFLRSILLYRVCFFAFFATFMWGFYWSVTKTMKPRLQVISTNKKRQLM